jgi:hypothetical protein
VPCGGCDVESETCVPCTTGSECRAFSETFAACTGAHECTECAADADCAGNPGALGPRCDAVHGLCTCATDADCAGSTRGPRCRPDLGGHCGCDPGASDCPEGRQCRAGDLDLCVATPPDGGLPDGG